MYRSKEPPRRKRAPSVDHDVANRPGVWMRQEVVDTAEISIRPLEAVVRERAGAPLRLNGFTRNLRAAESLKRGGGEDSREHRQGGRDMTRLVTRFAATAGLALMASTAWAQAPSAPAPIEVEGKVRYIFKQQQEIQMDDGTMLSAT